MKIKIGSFSGGRTTVSGDNEDEIRFPRDVRSPANVVERNTDAQQLAAIENALSRLDNNTYGLCEACGDEISVRRLMTNPLTSTCDSCDD